MRGRSTVGLALVVGATLALVAGLVLQHRRAASLPVNVTVMTRNVYLGGDILRPFRAAAGLEGLPARAAAGAAVHDLRAVVDRTDFGVRSRLLAAEIAAARPDLVGLQEVALWRHGPLEPDRPGVPDSTDVDLDFLDLLLSALAGQEAAYDVAQVQTEADVEAPAFRPDDIASGRDIRLTLRDVVLVRRDAGVRVTDRGGGPYAARVERDLAGVAFVFVRGYAWVDVAVRGARLRFVTTHLESLSPDIALAQARELLAGPARPGALPVVVVADANSDPLDDRVPPGSSVAESAAYRALVAEAMSDQWLERSNAADPGRGLTAGLSESVDDASAMFDRRIDLVLARGTDRVPVRAGRGEMVGDEVADRDRRTGLWPSDHAGIVQQLRVG